MFGAYVKENRKALIALAVYTVVFALVFWLYRLPLGAAGYAALVCLFVLALWFAVDYRRFAARLRLRQRIQVDRPCRPPLLDTQRARCRPPRADDPQPARLSGPG